MTDEVQALLDALPPKRRAFVREYVVDWNATQAAIRAGYSEKTAYSQGERLLKNVEVKAAVDALAAKLGEKATLTAEKVLTDIARVRDKAEAAGRFNDALKASELEGKYLKMWVERMEHSVDESLAARILKARQRTKG